MIQQALFERVKTSLSEYVLEWTTPEFDRLDGQLPAIYLLDALSSLKAIEPFYLTAITGMDTGNETLAVLYHFCMGAAVITLRVVVDCHKPIVPSICNLIPYASPFERETGEMFGIVFSGTPDTSRLFLPDDWHEGVYPLRKDARLGEKPDDRSD